MKKLSVLLLSAMLSASLLGGCAGNNAVSEKQSSENTEVAAEEEEDTGDASLDDPRNQDEIGEKEMLVVSFGTSYNDNRRLSIGAVESAMEETFSDYSVRRAFTSQIIIDHVKDRDGEVIDNVKEALDRAVDNGVKELVVMPTHLMDGLEYNDLVDEIGDYADAFEKVSIGEPLLTSNEDYDEVADCIIKATSEYDDGNTAICFMGHGTEADSNEVYGKMQQVLTDKGMENYYVGTVEATPSLDDVIEAVKKKDYKRVVLKPLMVVAGDHANNDMAGDEDDSWKSCFEKEGYEVVTLLNGLGEDEGIREIYKRHAKAAVGKLSGKVADASEMTTVEDIGDAGMKPVFPASLNKDTYDVTMRCSSAMFKPVNIELEVSDDGMKAKLFMKSESYKYVYAGTAAEAAGDDENSYIPLSEGKKGKKYFEVPVRALDSGIALAAFSVRKEKWYDRTVLFESSSLKEDAFSEKLYTEVSSLGLEDGEYTAEVSLSGGSGRASVESPAEITVKGDKCTARITWSSPNYDFMMVDDKKYEPVNKDGNAVFEIPVKGFDHEMPVQADTTAMSKPHLIDYTLNFNSQTIKKK